MPAPGHTHPSRPPQGEDQGRPPQGEDQGRPPQGEDQGRPPQGEDWTALCDAPLPVGEAYAWAVRPDCGAVVVFTGTARDHSDGRPEVSALAYEAYEEQAVPRMAQVVRELRDRWPAVGRVVIVHRIGDVPIGEEAVLVVVSAPHRQEAFAAARFGIDAVKASVPVWKRERWSGGEDWGLEAQHLVDPAAVQAAPEVAEVPAAAEAGVGRR